MDIPKKRYAIRPLTKGVVFLLLVAVFSLFGMVAFTAKEPVYFLALFVAILVFSPVICHVLSEIEIGDAALIFQVKPFNIKQTIQWQDISKVVLEDYRRCNQVVVYDKEGKNIVINSHYINVQEIIDEINKRFPLSNYERIKKAFNPLSLGNIITFIAVLLGAILYFWIKIYRPDWYGYIVVHFL